MQKLKFGLSGYVRACWRALLRIGGLVSSDKHMRYQIVGAKLQIIGTLHVFPEDDCALPAWVEDAYTWADRLASEHLPEQLSQCSSLAEGQSLHALIGSDAWFTLCSRSNADQHMTMLDKLKPWAAMLFALVQSMRHVSPGVEQVLWSRENDRGRAVDFIETGAEVAQIFDEVPIHVWGRAISELPSQPEIRREIEELYDAWVAGDVKKYSAVRPPDGKVINPQVRQAMFDERNVRWARRIKSHRAHDVKTLLLVGASHLVGPRNLIDCLRKEGVAISRVPISA